MKTLRSAEVLLADDGRLLIRVPVPGRPTVVLTYYTTRQQEFGLQQAWRLAHQPQIDPAGVADAVGSF